MGHAQQCKAVHPALSHPAPGCMLVSSSSASSYPGWGAAPSRSGSATWSASAPLNSRAENRASTAGATRLQWLINYKCTMSIVNGAILLIKIPDSSSADRLGCASQGDEPAHPEA